MRVRRVMVGLQYGTVCHDPGACSDYIKLIVATICERSFYMTKYHTSTDDRIIEGATGRPPDFMKRRGTLTVFEVRDSTVRVLKRNDQVKSIFQIGRSLTLALAIIALS